MDRMKKKFFSLSAGIAAAFILTVFVLLTAGTRSRTIGHGGDPGDVRVPKTVVDTPAQAYEHWKQGQLRGRIVISFSRTLDFVDVDDLSLIPPGSGDRVFNLAQSAESRLDDRNLLFMAMRTGIAREVIHVVPGSLYADKIEAAKADRDASIVSGKIRAPFFGSPRSIMPASLLKAPAEPVLLYINASFFLDEDPEALFLLLRDKRIVTDAVVLCRAGAVNAGTALERKRFNSFVAMLGGTPLSSSVRPD
jgi:hypothetical protein